MTPFKERMNLYRAYREQNPDKNYWDWKQSLEVPAMQDGGVSDYITQQIQAVREKAYQNSLNRTMPRVPTITGKIAEVFEYDGTTTDALIQQLNNISYQIGQATGQNLIDLQNKEAAILSQLARVLNSENGQVVNTVYAPTNGPSCMYTATDNYGEQYLQPSTNVFMEQVGRNGFRQIPIGNVKKGDIVIYTPNKGLNHGMIFDGYDEQGNKLYNYSDGGSDSNAIKKHAKYPTTDDMLRAYEFVGTTEDSARWINEYEKLQNVVPAMQNGGENKLLQDPTVKTITFPDGSIVQTKHVWANQQGLQNTPIADMFNPMNDVYDFIQVGKDALEGNWAGVGTGLALAMVPNVIEKPLKGVIKRIGNRLRTHSPYAKSVDNYDKKVQEFFVNDVAPRMRNNDKLIDDYVNNADNFKYDVVDASEFDENVAGKFVPSRGVIEMNEAFNNRPDFQYILGHEQRHDLSNTISITPEQRKLLKQAYVVPDMPFTDRSHLWKEMEATNTQIRQILYEQLLREGEDVTVDMLNRYIDMIDDSTLADLLQNVNVYGQDYSKSLYKNGKLDKTAMLNFRNALKYVPAVVPAIVTPWMMSNIEDKSN